MLELTHNSSFLASSSVQTGPNSQEQSRAFIEACLLYRAYGALVRRYRVYRCDCVSGGAKLYAAPRQQSAGRRVWIALFGCVHGPSVIIYGSRDRIGVAADGECENQSQNCCQSLHDSSLETLLEQGFVQTHVVGYN
jgi:hypothetical protein